jgi:hypothetical protein
MTPRVHATRADNAATPTSAWRSILELGRLAPTPPNSQWYFVHVVDSETARVCIDESIAIPFTDPNDQFRYLGLGVFVRHLELAAGAVGFEVQTSFDERDGSGPVVARIGARRAPDGALAARLRTRQTSRFAYGAEPVSDGAIRAVQALSDRRTSLTITTDPQIVTTVVELNNEMLVGDLLDRGTSRELDHWIRYTKRSRRRFRSGFTPASLATPTWKILGCVPTEVAAAVRCDPSMAHDAVPVTEPRLQRGMDLRAAGDASRPVPGGQDPDGCLDHADRARLLHAAVRLDHHR